MREGMERAIERRERGERERDRQTDRERGPEPRTHITDEEHDLAAWCVCVIQARGKGAGEEKQDRREACWTHIQDVTEKRRKQEEHTERENTERTTSPTWLWRASEPPMSELAHNGVELEGGRGDWGGEREEGQRREKKERIYT